MNKIFNIVYHILQKTSIILGISYERVNILFYFILLPYFGLLLINLIISNCFLLFSIILYFIFNREEFYTYLFNKCVIFLEYFGNYKKSSVIFCVFLPIFIFIILIFMKFYN